MSFDALTGILVIPMLAAALLAALPGYRLTARLNVLAALATFLIALSLFVVRPRPGVADGETKLSFYLDLAEHATERRVGA